MAERDVSPRIPKNISPKAVIVVIFVVVLLIIIFSSFFVVDQKEEGVVLRFGRFSRIASPGLHFKLPFGIERNINVPIQRVLKAEFGFRTEQPGVTTIYSARDYPEESLMLSGDLNIVDVEWIIQYRISDPKAWLFHVENQEKTIKDISQSVINLLVGDRTILDVIGKQRSAIESLGQDMMNEYYNFYGLGARVTTVKLQNIVPPRGRVQDAYEDVNKAIQDRSRLINEGKEDYNQAIPRARGEAKKIVQEAEGYATERINRAQGEVNRFLAVLKEYERNSQVTRTRLYYEMFEAVFGDEETIDLVDKNLKNFIPFKALSEGLEGGTR